MRTVEVLMVAVILFSAFTITSYFAILPAPRQISSPNLRELAFSTIDTLNAEGDLSRTIFSAPSDPSWGSLQMVVTSVLPPNIVYNLSAYDIVTSPEGTVTYSLVRSISNFESDLGVASDASSHFIASPNVTFTRTAQKIDGTLYILNCDDANGWWITGYTAQSLTLDIQQMLAPYFQVTILVNTTDQLGRLLNGTALAGETLQDAVVINTFGEAVPIPAGYYTTQGYDAFDDDDGSYARYTYILGQKVNQYNWTWVSIVGYPFYYVTNTETFASAQNSWGIYGMERVGPAGLNAFLQGLDNQSYSYESNGITGSPGVVQLTAEAQYFCNYYGIYPAVYHTSTRALPTSILSTYNLNVKSAGYVFQVVDDWIPGATFNHHEPDNTIQGSLTAIGLTRIPDIRITALAMLQYYQPSIYKREFGAVGTSKLVVLQLAQEGGI